MVTAAVVKGIAAADHAVTNPVAVALSGIVSGYAEESVELPGNETVTFDWYAPAENTGLATVPVTTVGPVATLSHK